MSFDPVPNDLCLVPFETIHPYNHLYEFNDDAISFFSGCLFSCRPNASIYISISEPNQYVIALEHLKHALPKC